MTRVIFDVDLDALSLMPIALSAMEQAFRLRSKHLLVAPPRHRVEFPNFGEVVFTIGGSTDEKSFAGFRAYHTFAKQEEQLIAIWSREHGTLEAVAIGDRIGVTRTGAIGGIAIKFMSNCDARVVGVIGSGRQARAQLEAAAEVRNVEIARVYSPNEMNRMLCATEMSRKLGIPVHAVPSAQEAVEGADIVVCSTSSTTTVLDTSWLKPGAHVTAMGRKTKGMSELSSDIARAATTIATDSPSELEKLGPTFFLSDEIPADEVVDLTSIVAGNKLPRVNTTDITLFLSMGLAGTEVLLCSQILDALNKLNMQTV